LKNEGSGLITSFRANHRRGFCQPGKVCAPGALALVGLFGDLFQ